jgi:hypothetical protein
VKPPLTIPLCFSLAAAVCGLALAQADRAEQQRPSVAGLTFAERVTYAERALPTNDWQKIPREVPPAPADPQRKAVRQVRDQRCDHLIGAIAPLDGDSKPISMTSGPSHFETSGFPDTKGLTVVIGTFDDYDVILSESRRSICTEEHIGVEQMFQAEPASIGPGSRLTLQQLGGTVQLPNKIVSYRTTPRIEVLVPQRRYLLFLSPRPDCDSYDLIKSWELLGGKALPTFGVDITEARKGLSKYAGMDEPEFLRAVSESIKAQAAPQGAKP